MKQKNRKNILTAAAAGCMAAAAVFFIATAGKDHGTKSSDTPIIESSKLKFTGEEYVINARRFRYYEFGKSLSAAGTYVLGVKKSGEDEKYFYSLKVPLILNGFDFGGGVEEIITYSLDNSRPDTIIFSLKAPDARQRDECEKNMIKLFREIRKYRKEKEIKGTVTAERRQ